MGYKYYHFDEPVNVLMIATGADIALLKYQEQVADIQDGVSFNEVSSSDFIEKLSATTTEDMPTIERGLKKSAIEVQEALFDLASTGNEAMILTGIHALI